MKRVNKTRTAVRIVLGLTLAAAGSFLSAQEKPNRGPEETASVSGESNRPPGGLDADAVAVLGRPEGSAPDPATINARSKDIDSKLRCPVCQGVSIADSPSGMATNMRAQVRELVGQGYSDEQVMTYFERSYGEFVRLQPPLRGLNWMLWVLPALVLAGGAFLVFRMARQPAPAPPPQGGAPATRPVDPELQKYLERIRRDSGTSA